MKEGRKREEGVMRRKRKVDSERFFCDGCEVNKKFGNFVTESL